MELQHAYINVDMSQPSTTQTSSEQTSNAKIKTTQIDTSDMTNEAVTCSACEAVCCRMEVMIITDTGVPARYIDVDEWGGETMARLSDGWCSALDRNTMMCMIYEQRPLICREFAMGKDECIEARKQYP